jgi:quercetin dioxygenase-like cupin family protein
MLLDAQRLTVLDQPLRSPTKGKAQVSSSIIVIEPGQETGWEKSPTPMYVYVLEGALTVEYDGGLVKEYRAGTALLEAVGTWRNGTNAGTEPVRILVVSMGAKGLKNTVERR